MSKFKRYTKLVYPIAGIRWVDKDYISGSDGILFNIRRIDTDTQRRIISDEQYLISFDEFVKRVAEELNITP